MQRRRVVTPVIVWIALAGAFGPVSSWSATSAERLWPHMLYAPHGDDCLFTPHECRKSDWLDYLKGSKLDELDAPAGGRAYRWLWVGISSFTIPIPTGPGYVEIVVDKEGHAQIRSVWHPRFVMMRAADLARFEAALGASKFASAAEQDQNLALDYPPEELMEAVIDGQYHFVHRIGRIDEPGIHDAGVLLEGFARHSPRK